MTDQEFLKMLKDKKVADAYQYYTSSRYKLALARISYDALDKIIKNYVELGKESVEKFFADAIETGKGEYEPHSESVNFCGVEIGISTAMNKLTIEIISLLHNFFDTYAQWINASIFGENALDISRVSLKSVAKEIAKNPNYSSRFFTDFCDIVNKPEYLYISDFNNILKHRSQIYVENSIDIFTAEGSVAIPDFEKDARTHSKKEVLDILKTALEYCENQLYYSRQFIENHYLNFDCLYISHRIYNPKTYLFYESKSDFDDGRAPISHYYYIEVDSINLLTEYHIMLVSNKEGDGRIELYNSPYSVVMLRDKNSDNIIGIMKPKDGEIYEIKDSHDLRYRKYIVQTTDFENEKTQTMCMGDFQCFPCLSEVTIKYGTEDRKKAESNESNAITNDTDVTNSINRTESSTND